jgi:protein involved in polysaccharide export with SLBB domain
MKPSTKITTAFFVIFVSLITAVCASPEISPNTTLSIKIYGVTNGEQSKFDGSYTVDPKGFIYLPLLKDGIRASGLSSSKLARNIEKAYVNAGMYVNPRINVISNKDEEAQKIDAQIISVGGFVSRPGPVQFTRGMTLFDAVAAAGGADTFGSDKRVELHRNGAKIGTYNIRLAKDMRIPVYPGDTIKVPQKTVFGN